MIVETCNILENQNIKSNEQIKKTIVLFSNRYPLVDVYNL
jgi:hypothetical protein